MEIRGVTRARLQKEKQRIPPLDYQPHYHFLQIRWGPRNGLQTLKVSHLNLVNLTEKQKKNEKPVLREDETEKERQRVFLSMFFYHN